jgi:hypothetical protein
MIAFWEIWTSVLEVYIGSIIWEIKFHCVPSFVSVLGLVIK